MRERERERERYGVKKNASDVILITMHNKIIFFLFSSHEQCISIAMELKKINLTLLLSMIFMFEKLKYSNI